MIEYVYVKETGQAVQQADRTGTMVAVWMTQLGITKAHGSLLGTEG